MKEQCKKSLNTNDAVLCRQVLCSETVNIPESDFTVTYCFIKSHSSPNDSPVYGFSAALYENGALKSKAEEQAETDISKAIKLYGLLIKNKVTPIDLKYVIEDFV